MCEWGTKKIVHCPAGFNGLGEKANNGYYVHVDACIADIVDALNKGGVLTLDSCCAHGEGDGCIRLMDGRELWIRQGRRRDG